MNLIKVLQDYQLATGVSAERLATMSGVSNTTIKKLLNGGIIGKDLYAKIANCEAVVAFANGLDVDKWMGFANENQRMSAAIAKAQKVQAEREKGKVLVKIANGTWVLRHPDDASREFVKREIMCFGKGYEEKNGK